jgi:hypothetical protein
MLQLGTNTDKAHPVTPADRTRWLTQIPQTLAGRPCGCGNCPSIELTDPTGQTPATSAGRLVLEAEATQAWLLLSVDEDRPNYLELAPLDPDATITEFPDATKVHTA